jgi:hypothetical protein
MEEQKKEEIPLPLAMVRMSQKMHTIKKNWSAEGKHKYATLDHILNKFHGCSGKEIPLCIYFNEKYLGESVYEMECVLYHVDSGEKRRCSVVAQMSNGDIPRHSDGRPQFNVVQWAGEKQTYLMRMSLWSALGISPNEDNDCSFGEGRESYASKHFK